MRDSFEKKVQDKLDELNLTPTAPVWDKIEAQIKPPKNRRPGFFWVPFLLIFLGGIGWWLTAGQKADEKQVTTTNDGHTEANSPANIPASESIPASNDETSRTQRRESVPPVLLPNDKEAKTTVFTSSNKPAIVARQKDNIIAVRNTVPASRGLSRKTAAKEKAARDESLVLQTTDAATNILQGSQEKTTAADTNNELLNADAKTKAGVSDAAPVDSLSEPAITDKKEPAILYNDSVSVKKKIATATKKWKFSLAVQAGRSTPFNGRATAVRYDAPPYQNSTGGSGNLYTNAPYPNPASRGMAFAIGAGLAREVSERLQVSVGLRYALWQTHTKVGSFKPLDTALAFQSRSVAVNGYYLSGFQQAYTNRFHLLEIPLSLDYQVLRSLPLFVSAGAVYGRLLNSNALTYDKTSMVYYENKEALSHNQFSVFSSLQYGIINRPSLRITAGPVAQWQVTSLQQENGTARPRLFVTGIKTALQF